MAEKQDPFSGLEHLVKMLLHRFDLPTREDIGALHTRLDRLEQLLYQKNSVAGIKSEKPVLKKKNASSTVMDVIAAHPRGTNFKTIKAATGFDDKKIRNIIFRLEKINRISRVKRGIYKTA